MCANGISPRHHKTFTDIAICYFERSREALTEKRDLIKFYFISYHNYLLNFILARFLTKINYV